MKRTREQASRSASPAHSRVALPTRGPRSAGTQRMQVDDRQVLTHRTHRDHRASTEPHMWRGEHSATDIVHAPMRPRRRPRPATSTTLATHHAARRAGCATGWRAEQRAACTDACAPLLGAPPPSHTNARTHAATALAATHERTQPARTAAIRDAARRSLAGSSRIARLSARASRPPPRRRRRRPRAGGRPTPWRRPAWRRRRAWRRGSCWRRRCAPSCRCRGGAPA